MIARLHIPCAPLGNFIESFFYYTGFNPEHSVDRFLPDGNVQMIFDLTDYPKFIYDNKTLKEIQACKNVWFSGFRTEPITIPSGRESEMIVVNFHMGQAFPFVSEPMQHLTNHVVDAELVLNKEILDLRDRLQDAKAIARKFEILEHGLLRQYQSQLEENPFVDYVIRTISETPNQRNLKEISDKVGYSQKHLINIFRKNVGVAPKEFLRIMRFQRAIQEIEMRNKINWSAIAYDCGYYDQSHFIADFKTFSGFTPAKYLSQRGEHLNYLPIT